MRILFLDDDETRHRAILPQAIGHDFTAVRNVAEAKKALAGDAFDLACLDHDLGGLTYVPSHMEETGHTVAKHIAAMPAERRPTRIIVHSFNRDGAINMVRTLREAGHERVTWIPFGEWALEPLEQKA